MKDVSNQSIIVSSGVHKTYFALGAGLAALCVYVVLFDKNTLRESTFFIATSLWLIFLSRPGKVKLYSDKLIFRSFIFSQKTFAFENLWWAHFPDDGGANLYFGNKEVTLETDIPNHKRLRTTLEKIGQERLPYFGYMTSDRASIKRGQLSGCLDCLSLFPPQDIKSWTKVPSSFLSKNKSDLFYPWCPECGERWVFTNKVRGNSATVEGIQKLDAVLRKDENGNRIIPLGLI